MLAASAVKTQVVCGPTCRHGRRLRLARQRRGRDLEEAREDERLRQRKCRELRREREERQGRDSAIASSQGPAGTRDRHERAKCHEPASSSISLDLQNEIGEIVDRVTRLSRASLQREIAALMRRRGPPTGSGLAHVTNQPPAAMP